MNKCILSLPNQRFSASFLIDIHNSSDNKKIPPINNKYLGKSFPNIHNLLQSIYSSDVRKYFSNYTSVFKNNSNFPIVRINNEFRLSEFLEICDNKKVFFDLKEGDIISNITKEDIEKAFNMRLLGKVILPEFSYAYKENKTEEEQPLTLNEFYQKYLTQNTFSTIENIYKLIVNNQKRGFDAAFIYNESSEYFTKVKFSREKFDLLYNYALHNNNMNNYILPIELLELTVNFNKLNKYLTNYKNIFYANSKF